ATIAVPLASPLGIWPGGLCVKRSSSCCCDIFNISETVTAIFSPFVNVNHVCLRTFDRRLYRPWPAMLTGSRGQFKIFWCEAGTPPAREPGKCDRLSAWCPDVFSTPALVQR